MIAVGGCCNHRVMKRPTSEQNRENVVRRNRVRKVIEPQMKFGETDIGAIVLDPKSRDDIPQILRGLQYIYSEPSLREPVFAILEEVLPQRAGAEGKASANTGRPGMEQWKILVLGVLRLGLNLCPTV